MTLIIGIEDPQQKRAIVFADSGVWRSQDRADNLDQPKIWRSFGWVIGVSGNLSQSHIVRNKYLPELPASSSLDTVIDALCAWSTEVLTAMGAMHQRIRQADPSREFGRYDILAAHGSRVFHVYDQNATHTTRGYVSIGMWDYSEGALSALSDKPPFQQGQRAMLAVDAIVDSVRAPFRWLATDGTGGEF